MSTATPPKGSIESENPFIAKNSNVRRSEKRAFHNFGAMRYEGFAREEHVSRVEVESIDGGRGTILPKIIRWSHGEEMKVEYIVHWMRLHTNDSDVKLFKYTLHVLGHPAFLYREEYQDGSMTWYWGLV